MKNLIRSIGLFFLKILFPRLYYIEKNQGDVTMLAKNLSQSEVSNLASIAGPAQISNCKIGAHTYISRNSMINMTNIGKYCSIGPNLFSGWGIHPTNGVSTSPMFYSNRNQAGASFSNMNKIEERKTIEIGNDVLIGMNVTILDGVKIGDGAVIGAGSVVSKDIPPYAIAVGAPIKIIRYRLDENEIEALLKIKWWDFDDDKLKSVEEHFFEIDKFIEKFEKQA